MRFVGIDIASERHVVAIVSEAGDVLVKATPFGEDAEGHAKLLALLGEPNETLVAMEATGHYWRNLFTVLVAHEFSVALINPLRTRRFAEEDLQRTKTDAIDAVGIARFAAQKRPAVTKLQDAATDELRELVRLRERLVQDLGDRVRQLHRAMDLCFPELPRYVKSLDSSLATTLLHKYPTAAAFRGVPTRRVAGLVYDGRHKVGRELAEQLRAAADCSVGQHDGEAYHVQVRYFCEDIDVLRDRIARLDRDIERKVEEHEVGKLLTTIDGIGPQTAARIIGEVGNPADFDSAAALASYVGAVPALRQSGKSASARARATCIGNARLRSALYMPILSAVRANAWLKVFYDRLIAAGKLPKVALLASMRKLLTAVYSVAKNKRPFVAHVQTETT